MEIRYNLSTKAQTDGNLFSEIYKNYKMKQDKTNKLELMIEKIPLQNEARSNNICPINFSTISKNEVLHKDLTFKINADKLENFIKNQQEKNNKIFNLLKKNIPERELVAFQFKTKTHNRISNIISKMKQYFKK